jgi:hypothetical protein
MKKSVALSVLSILAATSAFAANDQVLLSKTRSSGFVPVSMVNSSVCEVYADRIVVSKYVSQVSVTKITQIELKGDLAGQIAQAATGVITNTPAPTDGPITSWTAYQYLAGVKSSVELKAEGSERYSNNSQSTNGLINLIDELCN